MRKVQKTESSSKTEKLGDVVNRILKEQIVPKQAKFSRLIDCWEEILPSELVEHSYIENITAGQLIVRVDAPSYKYELQLCGDEILQQLKTRCSAARIEEIKIVIS
jgi:hypothetical protein